MHATLSYRQLGLHAVPRINKVSKINKTKSHHHFTISAFSWIISKFQTVTFGYSANRIFKSVGISNMLELTHSGSLNQSSKVVYKTNTKINTILLLLPAARYQQPKADSACITVQNQHSARYILRSQMLRKCNIATV